MKINVFRKDYPLLFPFKLSYGTYYSRTGILLSVQEGDFTGYGELSLVPYYHKDESRIQDDIDKVAEFLKEEKDEWTPSDLYEKIFTAVHPDPVVQSAIDCALYDLYGKKIGYPIWQVVEGKSSTDVESSLTITIDDWKEKLEWGWSILKLKMGFPGDMELLEEVRRNYDGPLRIDANAGWSIEDLNRNMDGLLRAEVEMVEQPLSPGEDHKLKEQNYPVIFVADESVQNLESLEKIAEYYDGINIKLQKCGGITSALRMIRRAQELDLKLMAGCMTESSVGIGAMAHLSSFFDYLDLDGEYLIKYDFGRTKYVKKGKILLSENPGIGQNFQLK